MLSCMQQAFPAFLPVYSAYSWLEHQQVIPELLEQHDIIAMAGHYSWGIHRLFPEEVKCYYFTILRDPVALAQSQLGYQQTKGSHACRGQIVDRWVLEHGFSSLTQHLSGGPLQPALDKIDSRYAYVGFTERFDRSLSDLSELTGVPFVQPERKNVSSIRPRASAEVVEHVRQRGGPDFTLYDHALIRWGESACAVMGGELSKNQRGEVSESSTLIQRITDNEVDAFMGLPGEAFMDLSDLKVIHENFGMRVDDDILITVIAKHKDLVPHSLSPDLISSQAVTDAFMAVANDLARLSVSGEADALNGQLANLYLFMAHMRILVTDPDQAEQFFKKAISLGANTSRCKHAYMVWLRQKGRIHEALNLLGQLSEGMDQRALREAVVTLSMEKDGRGIPAFLAEHSEAIGRTFHSKFMRKTMPYPTMGLEAMAGKRGLLIRSGPEVLCRDVLNQLRDTNADLDIVQQESCALDREYDFTRVFTVPDGKLEPQRLLEQEGETLTRTQYDYVLVVVSTVENLICARNILSLTKALNANAIWGYHFENIFYASNDKYVFDVTEER